jgi:hypothetical protein
MGLGFINGTIFQLNIAISQTGLRTFEHKQLDGVS